MEGFMRLVSVDDQFKSELVDCGGAVISEYFGDVFLWWSENGCFSEVLMEKNKEIVDICFDMIHIGYWKDVNVAWRDAYSLATVFFGLMNFTEGMLKEVITGLDKAILMGGPRFIHVLHELIEAALGMYNICFPRDLGDNVMEENVINENTEYPTIEYPIERVERISLFQFLNNYKNTNKPVIITDFVGSWPASTGERKWTINYLKQVAGLRTVPIEIGIDYRDESWSQQMMTIEEFIEKYIEPDNPEKIGYLAQTTLLEQIPKLKKDIMIPDYCIFGDENQQKIINAWFGPCGTRTPIHHDRYDNFLCQVFGRKYLRLYSQDQSPYLYPHEDKILFNTSQVTAEDPDISKFPLFSQAQYTECILSDGEMLYIPPLYWHYVRSLSRSFSISIWW